MSEEIWTLQQELESLELSALNRLYSLWNIPGTNKEKRTVIKKLILCMQDEFYIKGVLEKLSSTQVTIYSFLLRSKGNIMTLGDIARKISLPPMNAEMELGVLKRYRLVYQRKNRERLTNNLDRYHYYNENGKRVELNSNESNNKLRVSLAKVLIGSPVSPEWQKVFKNNISLNGSATTFNQKTSSIASEAKNIGNIISMWGSVEKELIRETFHQGGVMEMSRSREIIQNHKKDWENIVRKLNGSRILLDDYYIDNRFVRVMLLPQEVFHYLQKNPLPIAEKGWVKERQKKIICNDLDFFLNIKKLISYISSRGISLAKSGKIKQVDLRDMEDALLHTDTGLFIEKSQNYQVAHLLPVIRILDNIRLKDHDVVLRNDYEKIVEMNALQLADKVIEAITVERESRSFYEDIFMTRDVLFPKKELWLECINHIQKYKNIMHKVLMAMIIRNRLVLSHDFRIQNFHSQLNELSQELTSVIFYLQLFGLITVEYPERKITLSDIGMFLIFKKSLDRKDQMGGLILNADMSIIAIPEKVSLKTMLLLKSFAKIKLFDNVYTFQITKKSFQSGLLLKEKPEYLIEAIKRCSPNKLSQNFLFSIEDWSSTLPLVKIIDECVVIQTKEAKHMDSLLGQINSKRIVQEKLSPTTILIYKNKIHDIIESAEKLELIVKLIR